MPKIPAFVPWEERPIEFLCVRRFPELFQLKSGWITYPSRNGDELHFHELEGNFNHSPEMRQKIEQAEKYMAELAALPHGELMRIFNVEYSIWELEKARKAEEEEKQLFFNRPESFADMKHWAKMAVWTLDEAVALSLGKDPIRVSISSMSNSRERFVPVAWLQSDFPKEYARRTELVQRAKLAGILSDHVSPENFMRWAADVFEEIPHELHEKFLTHARPKIPLDRYPSELRIAIEAFEAVSADSSLSSAPKKALRKWLDANKPELTNEARERIAIVANWKPTGGAPKTPTRKGG